MEDGVEFELALKNEMSGPAHEAKSAISELTAALKANSEAIRGAEGGHKKLGESLHEAGEKAKESEGFFKEFGKSLIPQIALGELAAEGIKKIGETIVEGFKFAVEASEFKENMTDAYSVVLDSADQGKAMFEEVDALAATVHMPAEKAHELASSLMLQGLESQEAVQSTIAAVSDLQRTGLAAGAAKLQSTIERSLAAGHFELGKGGKSLKGTGVSVDELYAQLAHNLHKSVQEVQYEMKAGKISVEDGTLALTGAIDKGKVGIIAAGKYGIGDVVTDIKNTVRGLFQETNVSPLIDAFKSVAESIKPGSEGAKEFKETLDGLVSVAGDLVSAAASIAGAFGDAFLGLKHLAEGAIDTLSDVGKKIQDTFGTKEDKAWSAQAEKDVDERQNKLLRERSGKAWVADAVKGGGIDIDKWAAEGDAKNAAVVAIPVGHDIGQGLAYGIRETKADVYAAGHELGKAAHEGAKAGADAHSPSRKMFELGQDMGEGLMLGWEDMLGDIHKGMSLSVMPPHLDVRGGQGGSRVVDIGGIHVEVHGVANADEIMTLLPSAIVDMLEQASNEAGA